jgi:hypothetical protein
VARFSSAQYAELAVPGAKYHVLIEIDLPDDTTARLAPTTLGRGGTGTYYERIESLSSFARRIDFRRCALQSPTVTCKVRNADLWWSIKEATFGPALYNSAVRILCASPGTSSSDWLTHYTGRLVGWDSLDTATLKFRPPDAKLRAKIQLKRVGDNFPDAPEANLQTEVPLCYGRISDRGAATMEGMVTGIQVDSAGDNFLLCYGWLTNVLDVFVNGTRLTSGWTATYGFAGGHRYTWIEFAVARPGAAITANVEGYESVGDRSGTFIAHTLDQVRHVMTNWVFAESAGGLWVDDSSLPIDGASCDAAIASLAGRAGGGDYAGTQYITTGQRGQDLLDRACLSVLVPSAWTSAGQVGFVYDDLHTADYPTSLVLKHYDLRENVQPIVDGADVTSFVRAGWAPEATAQGSAECQNLIYSGGASEEIDLLWAGASAR